MIAHSKPSKYNPSWKERFMDRQTADSDMMAAARLAKQFNDNLHHEVRVATNREPIPHLGEFPTTMKLNPVTYDHKSTSGDRIRAKLDEMVSKEPEFALKVGWQDDEDQYQRVLEQLISLDPAEQVELLLKIMRNEKRSNNSRIISRLRTFISMIEDGVLGISIEELHMICVKTNYDMQIEQAMLQEIGVSLDPIRNKIIEEENLMIGEDELFEEQAPDEQQYEVPIQYRPINKRQKLVTSTEMPDEAQAEVQDEGEIQEQDEAEIQDEVEAPKGKKTAHQEAMHEDLMGPVEEMHYHPQIKRKMKQIDEYVVQRRPDIRRELTPEPLIYPTQLPRQIYNDPVYAREPIHIYDDEYYDSDLDEAQVPRDVHHIHTRQIVHQLQVPHKIQHLPHYNHQPNHDVMAVFGRNSKGPYFNYDKRALHQDPRTNDIAQSINIVTGADNIEKQSISISKDEPMKSINIVFDDTMAEINKEQDLYHRYRNQKHQINRDSYRHPEDRQYPDIHTGSILDKPKKPYYNQPQMPFYVPSSPYETFNPYPDPYYMDAPYPVDQINQAYPPSYPPQVFDYPPEYIDPLAGPMPMVLDPRYTSQIGDLADANATQNPVQDEATEDKGSEEKTGEARERELEEQEQKEEAREEKEDQREDVECKREEAEDKREEQEDKREAQEEKREEEEEKREEEEEKREEIEEKKEEEQEKKDECEIKEEIEEQKEELKKHQQHHEEKIVVDQQPQESAHDHAHQAESNAHEAEAQVPVMTPEQQYAAAILYCQNNRLDPFCLQFGDPFDVSVKYDKNDPRSFGIYEKDLFGRDGQPVAIDQRQNFNPSRAIGKELEREGLTQPGGFPLGYVPGQPGFQPGFQPGNPYGQYGQPYGRGAPGYSTGPYGGLPNDYLPYGSPYYRPQGYNDYYRPNGDPEHDQLVRDRQKRLREYHIYEHYLDYKDKRGKYDSRTKGEREEDRKRAYVTKDLQKKSVKIRRDPDEDDWAGRPKSKASQHDTAGKEFSKTLKQQRQAEKDQELEDQQLEAMGLKPQNKKPKSKKQTKKPKSKGGKNKQESDEYKVQGLAANEHEVQDSSSLNNQHQNDNKKDERQKDLKYQARGNSEKSQENKEFNKQEPVLNNFIQISQQQSQCRGILERDRLFVCTECNATEVFILNDESWYLISLSKGYKQEFHHFFKYFRELVNPKYLLTSFGEKGICFASNYEQTVNITNLLQLVQKNLTASFIKIQDMVTMNYFQLKYVNSKQFSNFALEITSKEHFDRWGMNVNKLNLNFNDQQYSITYYGTLQAHSKLKFSFEEQNTNVNIQTFTLYINISHDITVADSIIRNYFQPEYQQLLQSYLQKAPHGASILQVRRHQSEQLFDIQISLRS